MTNTLTRWQRAHGGFKVGDKIILAASRRSGKSALTQAHLKEYYQKEIDSQWCEWESTFVWPWNRKMSVTKEMIWGKIMQRRNKMVKFTLYATKKELFQLKLKGIDN